MNTSKDEGKGSDVGDEEKGGEEKSELNDKSVSKGRERSKNKSRSRSHSKSKKLLDNDDSATVKDSKPRRNKKNNDTSEEKIQEDVSGEGSYDKKKKKKKNSSKKGDDENKSLQSSESDGKKKKKNKKDEEKTPLTNDDSNRKSPYYGKLMSGFSPVRQSIDDRDGNTSACCSFPIMSEDVMDNEMCLSRDECSWICCRSEKLGSLNYNLQRFVCLPLIYSRQCSCKYVQCCVLAMSESCPCIGWAGLGLQRHSQPHPDNLDKIEKTRESLKSQHKGLKDDICLIRVIGCDRPLIEHVNVLHPMARIHAVNIRTGQYLKKQHQVDPYSKDQSTGATTTYESSSIFSSKTGDDDNEDDESVDSSNDTNLKYNEPCDVLLPVSTTPYSLGRCMESIQWESGGGGDLLINEPYSTILDPETLLLIEICDITSTSVAKNKSSDHGFVGIAWGFLMPVSRNGRPCIGVRGGSINDEKLGATPRDFRLNRMSAQAQNRGQNASSHQFADSDLESKRLTIQLFYWNHDIDPFALAQAKHRGILPLSPPAASLVPSVYLQWYLKSRRPYPVTLALRIGPFSRPHTQYIEHRPSNALQVERGNKTKEQHLGAVAEDGTEGDESFSQEEGDFNKRTSITANTPKISEAVARRLWTEGSKCALPNKLLLRKSLGSGGATALKYSHCGRWMAVALSSEEKKFPIVVFDLNEEDGVAKLGCTLRGHVSLVHDLDWSLDDRFLVSASRDGSAIVWSVENLTDKTRKRRRSTLTSPDGKGNQSSSSPLAQKSPISPPSFPTTTSATQSIKNGCFAFRVLHPSASMLYAARFLSRQKQAPVSSTPSSPTQLNQLDAPCPLVVTGGFDGSVILWDPCKEHANLGFLGGYQTALHRFGVTALMVDHKTLRVFSGDSDGIIWSWVATSSSSSSPSHGTPSKNNSDTSDVDVVKFHTESRPINHPALRGRTITCLELEPSQKTSRRGSSNLLVAAHGNLILLFDSEAKALLAQYHGALLHTSAIRARFSPDGRFVVSGSEDGRVVVWKANTSNAASRVEDLTLPVISHTKKACALSGMMRFNAPLLDVGWNPKQHCVAMVAAGGSFPLLVGYTDTPVVQETLKKDESTVGETILMASSHRYGNAEHTMNHTRRDSMMSGIVSAVMSSENEPRSKQILRTLAKARLSELRNRKFETVNSDDGEAKLDTPLRKQNSSVPAELLGRVDDDGDTSDTQIPLPSSSQYSAVDPSFH